VFLTRRLAFVAVALAVLAVVLPLHSAVWVQLLILNAVLVVAVVIDVLAAPALAKVSVRRSHPPVMVSGTDAALTWEISVNSARRTRVSIVDSLAPSLRAVRRGVTVVVPAGGTVRATTTVHPERRGRFALRDAVVRTFGPLGLAGRQGRRPVASVLRVHPPFRSRKDAELRMRRARVLDIGLRNSRGFGGGTEFEQLREYTADDEFRRLDWAATARVGKPIVRTYRPERNQSIIVMLDAGRLMAARSDGLPRIEHAMDAIMALGAVATRLGDKVGLLVFDTEVRNVIAPARHREQVTRMTEASYDTEPLLATSDYNAAFSGLLSRFRRRSLVIMLTELNEQAVDDALLPAIKLAVRQHVMVVASVGDGEIREWAAATPTDGEGAYRRAAAVQASSERQRAARRLAGVGVRVVDAPPGRLAAELCDLYLDLKGRGLL
jgi:uncharacterized protein (DUF58 family)